MCDCLNELFLIQKCNPQKKKKEEKECTKQMKDNVLRYERATKALLFLLTLPYYLNVHDLYYFFFRRAVLRKKKEEKNREQKNVYERLLKKKLG